VTRTSCYLVILRWFFANRIVDAVSCSCGRAAAVGEPASVRYPCCMCWFWLCSGLTVSCQTAMHSNGRCFLQTVKHQVTHQSHYLKAATWRPSTATWHWV